jgi:hypothetical protein
MALADRHRATAVGDVITLDVRRGDDQRMRDVVVGAGFAIEGVELE